jgi:hypothetical protein
MEEQMKCNLIGRLKERYAGGTKQEKGKDTESGRIEPWGLPSTGGG